MDEEIALEKPKKRLRKTIGEEGARKQTLIGLLLTVFLGLIFYTSTEFKQWWGQWQQVEIIRIEKPIASEIKDKKTAGVKSDPAAEIQELINDLNGNYGVYVKQLSGNKNVMINEDQAMTAASVIKLPVLAAYYQAVDKEKINPKEVYILEEKDRWVYGTGSMQNQPAGTEYTYQKIAYLVANESDNMGAEVLIKKLGGYAAVQNVVDQLGFKQTNLQENETTVKEMGELLGKIYLGKLISKISRQELLENLTNTVLEDRITAGVPSGVKVIHKFGSEAGVVNDCGVVEAKKPYVICVMTTGVNDGEAQAVLPEISKVVWDWLGG